MKNIVLCFDVGSDFGLGMWRTNVLKLHSLLSRDTRQIICYIPPKKKSGRGVAESVPGVIESLAKMDPVGFAVKLVTIFGRSEEFKRMASYGFGSGLLEQLVFGYEFLADNYEDGDKVFIFGFSRAAFIARILVHFVESLGLIEKQYRTEILRVVEEYAKRTTRKTLDFPLNTTFLKRNFSKSCKPHFLGLWEALRTPSWFFAPTLIPHFEASSGASIIRHAMAMDERRSLFRVKCFGQSAEAGNHDLLEVWFAGAHSDVGGGYSEPESRPSQIPLQWMLVEAAKAGLHVDLMQTSEMFGAGDGGASTNVGRVKSYLEAPLHKPLHGVWWVMECVPVMYRDTASNAQRWVIPLGSLRSIPPDSYIHRSVLERMKMMSYQPPNFPSSFQVIDTDNFNMANRL